MPRRSLAKLPALLLLAAGVFASAYAPARGRQPAAPAPDLKLRWEAVAKLNPPNAALLFDLEGKTLVLTGRGKIEALALDARTGKPGHELPAQADAQGSNFKQFRLQKGVFLFQQGRASAKELVTWDAVGGKVGRAPYPAVSTGIQLLNLSPDGRYTSVGSLYRPMLKDLAESAFRVIDSKTGKEVVATDLIYGTTAFTADSSRVLVVDATDRFRWFDLPSGRETGGWKFDRPADDRNAKVHGMSADGGVILYAGVPPGKGQGIHLLDGKTGEVLHTYRGYYVDAGLLAPDGRSVVLVRGTPAAGFTAEVLTDRGAVLGKLALPRHARLIVPPPLAVSWEAGLIATHDAETGKVAAYDLFAFAPASPATPAAGARPRARKADGPNRTPVPGDAAVAKAEAAVRAAFKADYANKSPAGRKALAQKLSNEAGKTADDPAARYVMLTEALDVAAGAGEPTLALQVIDKLAAGYQVEAAALQLEALERILASSAVTLPAVKGVIDSAGPASEKALGADEYDEAIEFALLAANGARKAKLGQTATDEADNRLAHARKARDAFAALRPALDALAANPDDPAANSTVGKFRCFAQGRWDEGLKHLAAGRDAALKAVAEADLRATRDKGDDEAKAAAAWWAYAQSAPADEQWAARVRSRHWYSRRLLMLAGLAKAEAEARLGFTAGDVEYRPGLVCDLSAKFPAVLKGTKARVDRTLDFSAGEFADVRQTELRLTWIGAIAPPRAGPYTLVVQTADPVRVKLDGRIVIDTVTLRTSRREAPVMLAERPYGITIDYVAPNLDKHKIKLAWTPPGKTAEELIPAEFLFHDKRSENVLGK